MVQVERSVNEGRREGGVAHKYLSLWWDGIADAKKRILGDNNFTSETCDNYSEKR